MRWKNTSDDDITRNIAIDISIVDGVYEIQPNREKPNIYISEDLSEKPTVIM